MKKPAKGRHVTPQERQQWAKAVARANPLRHRVDATDPEPLPAASEKEQRKARRPADTEVNPAPKASRALGSANPKDPVPKPAVAMDHKTYGRMKRGKMEPDARLDLHGMTQTRAHGALNAFILRAKASGHRLVLVITGKGSATRDEGPASPGAGILRRQVPRWLELPPLGQAVLQVTHAHARHGGSGAYYVYLRRR